MDYLILQYVDNSEEVPKAKVHWIEEGQIADTLRTIAYEMGVYTIEELREVVDIVWCNETMAIENYIEQL